MPSGGGGSETVTNQTILPQWVQNAAQQVWGQAQNVAGQPYTPYTGPTVAGLTPAQTAAYNYAQNNIGTGANAINAATNAITGPNLTSTAQSLLNPYLGQVENTTAATMQQQGQLAQNQLAGNAIQAGAFGGSRFGAEQGALTAQTNLGIGQMVAGIQSQGWDTAVNTALQQAGAVSGGASAAQTAGLQGASAAASAGQSEQNQAQAQLNSLLQQWTTQQNYPLQQLSILQGALTGLPYGATSVSSQPFQAANPIMSGLSGAAAGAAAGTAIGFPGIGTAAGGLLGLLGSRL